MLYFPEDTKGRNVGFVINPNVYNSPRFMKEMVLARLRSLGIEDIFDTLISFAAYVRPDGKKATKKMLEPYIDELLEFSDTQGIDTLLIANSQYFTYLTGAKYEASVGTAPKCTIKDYEHITVMPIINPIILKMQPTKKNLLEHSFFTASEVLKGIYDDSEFEFDNYVYVDNTKDAEEALEYLKTKDILTWDIETTGLHHIRDELVTQSLATSELESFSFVMHEKYLGKEEAKKMHNMFKEFFNEHQSKIVAHNFGFESKWLMSKYVMKDYNDFSGMYKYLDKFDWEDTMLMGYALENSTERISLTLKDMAKHKYGDWDSDIDIKDAINQPIEKLAYYNAIDTSATFYLYNKLDKELDGTQREFYETEMKATQETFTKIMCSGLPIHMPAVLEAEKELSARLGELNSVFYRNPYVIEATADLRERLSVKYNGSHKVKQVTADYFEDTQFNPNSNLQLQDLLFDTLGFTPTEFTKTKAPSTAKDVLVDLLELTTDETVKEVLECLVGFSEVTIILNTFINSFKRDSIELSKGEFRLYGNLRVGGTISFRPTSSNPNLLNMPSGSTYGGLLKKCFKAPEGKIIVSSDYSSLQGVTGANLTGDKASIKIYSEDIDLHCYMMTKYWTEEFEEGHPETAEWYNSLKKPYKDLRQKSKGLTFGLMFGAGPKKLAKMLGGDLEEGVRIWKIFHETYSGISAWGRKVAKFAETHGYIEVGLGLRLTTPTLTRKSKAVIAKLRNDDEVDDIDRIKAEAKQGGDERSAINATIQFWDHLTVQSITKFYKAIQEAGYENAVTPHATIYDAFYGTVTNDPEIIQWVNETLIGIMTSDYMEDQPVKLKANLDIGPTWAVQEELSNNCDLDEIKKVLSKVMV